MLADLLALRDGLSEDAWREKVAAVQAMRLAERRGVTDVGRSDEPEPQAEEPETPAAAYMPGDFVRLARLLLEDDEHDVRPDVGLPSMATSMPVYNTDESGVVARPHWLSREVMKVIDTAMDFGPDVAHAAWIAKMIGLGGATIESFVLGPDGATEDQSPEGLAACQDLLSNWLAAYGGGLDAGLLLGFDSLLRRGGVAVELDVADGLDDVLDIELLPPELVDFRVLREGRHRRLIPVYRGSAGAKTVSMAMSGGSGEGIPFNTSQFAYFGVNTRIGGPHGASPYMAIVETAPQQMGYRKSMQRVAASTAFSKQAFIVEYERMARSLPESIAQVGSDGSIRVIDQAAFNSAMDTALENISRKARKMYEDDTWTMYDIVKPTSVGAEHSGQTIPIKDLAELFDTDAIVAAHSQPQLHGRSYGSALSTTGQVQWVVAARGWEMLRLYPANAMEFALNQALRIRGVPAIVRVVFAPIRKEDRLAEAQAALIETETAIRWRDEGWIDNDEAAQKMTGHVAVGTPKEKKDDGGAAASLALLQVLPGTKD